MLFEVKKYFLFHFLLFLWAREIKLSSREVVQCVSYHEIFYMVFVWLSCADYDQYKQTCSACNLYIYAKEIQDCKRRLLTRNNNVSNISLSHRHIIKLQTQKYKVLIVISDQFRAWYSKGWFYSDGSESEVWLSFRK